MKKYEESNRNKPLQKQKKQEKTTKNKIKKKHLYTVTPKLTNLKSRYEKERGGKFSKAELKARRKNTQQRA